MTNIAKMYKACPISYKNIESLRGKTLLNNRVKLSLSLELVSNHPVFPKAEVLYIPNCMDQDYLFYQVDPMYYPNLKSIYMASVPDPLFFSKFGKHVNIHLDRDTMIYKCKYARDMDNVHITTDFHGLEFEEPIIKE